MAVVVLVKMNEFRKQNREQDVHRLGRGFRQNTIYTIMREHALWST